jgi:hypothetical protein
MLANRVNSRTRDELNVGLLTGAVNQYPGRLLKRVKR